MHEDDADLPPSLAAHGPVSDHEQRRRDGRPASMRDRLRAWWASWYGHSDWEPWKE